MTPLRCGLSSPTLAVDARPSTRNHVQQALSLQFGPKTKPQDVYGRLYGLGFRKSLIPFVLQLFSLGQNHTDICPKTDPGLENYPCAFVWFGMRHYSLAPGQARFMGFWHGLGCRKFDPMLDPFRVAVRRAGTKPLRHLQAFVWLGMRKV